MCEGPSWPDARTSCSPLPAADDPSSKMGGLDERTCMEPNPSQWKLDAGPGLVHVGHSPPPPATRAEETADDTLERGYPRWPTTAGRLERLETRPTQRCSRRGLSRKQAVLSCDARTSRRRRRVVWPLLRHGREAFSHGSCCEWFPTTWVWDRQHPHCGSGMDLRVLMVVGSTQPDPSSGLSRQSLVVTQARCGVLAGMAVVQKVSSHALTCAYPSSSCFGSTSPGLKRTVVALDAAGSGSVCRE